MIRTWVGRELHGSWLVAAWCLGVVIGVIAAMSLPYGLFSGIGWLLVGIVLLAPLANVRQAWILLIVVISGVFVGLWRGGVGQIGLDQYDNLIGRQVVICGVISEDPDVDKRGQTVLRVSDISVQGRELPGNVWVVTPKNDVLRRSDTVTVSGKMTEGFGEFAGAMYRAEIVTVERAVPGDVAVNVRDWFSERVRAHVPAPEVDLGLGYLLGLRRA